jgi:cytochrome c-type biogenesis protein CcmH/NrfF
MLRIASAVFLLNALGCAPVPVDDAPPEGRQVQTIVRNTLSPFCPGKTLDSCPSPKAGEWRRDIRAWVAAGVPEPEIRARLQERVPDFDLRIPPVKSGWVIPVVAVVLSTLWLIIMALKFRRRGSSKRRGEARQWEPSLDARLDEELARLD